MRSFTGILSGALLVLAVRVAAQGSPRGPSDAAGSVFARAGTSCPTGQYYKGNNCQGCEEGYRCPGIPRFTFMTFTSLPV